jgi:CHAT domain-containing protein
MKIFYIHMIDGDTKYEAFEKARRAMIESEDYNDPLYWAPFIMLD